MSRGNKVKVSYSMVHKIISGGQTGADQGALDAAIKLGIPHGGWIPKGRLTESGPLPEKYQLKEMPTASYPKRTARNVMDSDGTLIISNGELTGGSKYTRTVANKNHKPFLHINLSKAPAVRAASDILDWVNENKIQVLNVAGPRASKDPSIYEQVKGIILSLYYLSFVKDSMPELSGIKNEYPTITIEPEVPSTVDEAVDQIINAMPLKDRVTLSNLTYDELAGLQATLGMYIRKKLEVWQVNQSLLNSCRNKLGSADLDEYSAASVIIDEIWRKLRESHPLRVVK